ncbi:hypothetical protein BD309DRAFT_363771 [Dichomitus squalens]|nr:hypothetical protein BD309DRAFT_363771 [Dichomitus squalens]
MIDGPHHCSPSNPITAFHLLPPRFLLVHGLSFLPSLLTLPHVPFYLVSIRSAPSISVGGLLWALRQTSRHMRIRVPDEGLTAVSTEQQGEDATRGYER